ncbi:MAG: hypothetical protein Q8K36_03665, partial [Alphaproteobacteria bacterium]|nr:hypothetical protein [Alphaproteobacteria bacterium]
MRQYFNHANFTPVTSLPGNTVTLNTKFNSKDFELERHQFVAFDMTTTDGTNHLTLYNDCASLIDFIELEINNGSEKLSYDKPAFVELQRCEQFKEYANRIAEKRSESDVEYNTIAGVQVTDAVAQSFKINLFDVFPMLKDHVMKGFINDVKITIRFTPAPSNAKDACLIGRSNTTANAYSRASVTFDNIRLVRVFDIIRDGTIYSRPNIGPKGARILQPYYEVYKVEGINWNVVGNQQKIKINDHFKRSKTSRILAYLTVNASAYNASTAQKKYSGYNYIKWRLAETTGDRKELSFLSGSEDSTARLRNFEIAYQKSKYGEDLPIEVYTNSTDLNKYLLVNTIIPFNMVDISNQIYDTITLLDTAQAYYEVTFECAGAISTDCDLHVICESYEEYEFNG